MNPKLSRPRPRQRRRPSQGWSPRIAPPTRKSGGYWQKFTLLLAVLGLLAIGGGIAAIKFKDKDERLRAISDAIDAAAKNPESFASSVETKFAELWATVSSKVEGDRKSEPRQTAANESARRAKTRRRAEPDPGCRDAASNPHARLGRSRGAKASAGRERRTAGVHRAADARSLPPGRGQRSNRGAGQKNRTAGNDGPRGA